MYKARDCRILSWMLGSEQGLNTVEPCISHCGAVYIAPNEIFVTLLESAENGEYNGVVCVAVALLMIRRSIVKW